MELADVHTDSDLDALLRELAGQSLWVFEKGAYRLPVYYLLKRNGVYSDLDDFLEVKPLPKVLELWNSNGMRSIQDHPFG